MVKNLALKYSTEYKGGKFTRVSSDFLERINARVAIMIAGEVQRHPFVGKTLM